MPAKRYRGDETWNRLLFWSDAQKASERLAGHILAAEGYKSIDPSHPLGGRDGLKDITCKKDSVSWIAACYFPNGQKSFKDIQEKFLHDATAIPKKKNSGFIFLTNQYLKISEREKLAKSTQLKNTVIFHLEMVVHILNKPENYGIRLEFLDIEMNREEQIAFFADWSKKYFQDLEDFRQTIMGDIKSTIQEALPKQRR